MRRNSKQREMILQTIRENPIHPTAADVHALLCDKMPNLSLGTVYRNLDILATDGIIKKLVTGLTSEHYDGDTSPHNHFVCKCCQSVFDIARSDYSDKTIKELEKLGYKIDGYEQIFHGLCSGCNKLS